MSKRTKDRVCAIYGIRSITEDKVYVGASTCLQERWSQHKTDLKNGKHRNARLLEAFEKYGIDDLELLVLEKLDLSDKDKITEKEQFWIDKLDAANPEKGYNITPVAGKFFARGLSVSEDKKEHYREKSSTRLYVVTDPYGVEMEVRNLKGFCKDVDLDIRSFRLMTSCRKLSYKGWRCRYASMTKEEHELAVKTKSVVVNQTYDNTKWSRYRLTNIKTGQVVETPDIGEFCKSLGFLPATFAKVLAGKKKQTRGWTAVGIP